MKAALVALGRVKKRFEAMAVSGGAILCPGRRAKPYAGSADRTRNRYRQMSRTVFSVKKVKHDDRVHFEKTGYLFNCLLDKAARGTIIYGNDG